MHPLFISAVVGLCFVDNFEFVDSVVVEDRVRSSTRGWHDIFAGVVVGASSDTAQNVHIELPIQKVGGWYTLDAVVEKRKLHLIVDTGSAKLWIRSGQLASQSRATAQGAAFLAADDDFPGKKSMRNFSALYGRGSVHGETEDVSVGLGDSKAHVCELGVVESQSAFWASQSAIDGILGLGCGAGLQSGSSADAANSGISLSQDENDAPDTEPGEALPCVLPQAGVDSDHGVFSLRLGAQGGSLTLGFIPPQIMPSLTYLPPSEDCGHWNVPVNSVSAAGNSIWSVFDDARAIVDSGTDGIVGPTFAVIALAQALGGTPAKPAEGNGGLITFYTVPCETRSTLPSLMVRLGGATSSLLNVTMTGENLVHPLNADDADAGTDCRLRLAGWETQSWILGAAFFEAVDGVVFDAAKRQVAVAGKSA